MLDEEVALLKAITRDPKDDTVRLVYADWLTEHGDPDRAELIRLQCNLERGNDWQSGHPAEGKRLKELQDREKALIEVMCHPKEGEPGIREFTPELAAIVAADQSSITFKRGMIDSLFLDHTRITALPPDLHVGGNLYLEYTHITQLPPGLYVGGDLSLFFLPITAVPPDLHVGGNLRLWRTNIAKLPPGLHVGGDLDLAGTPIIQLPPGLHVGGYFFLSDTPITILPSDLHVGGGMNLTGTPITPEAARSILTMPNLSREAKISGLESLGLPALVAQARRLPGVNAGPGTPPRP